MTRALKNLFSAWPSLGSVSLHMAMDDSAPWLLEWVLYHRMMGFDKITVYGDGANRESHSLCNEIQQAGLICYRPTSTPGLSAARGRNESAMAAALSSDQKGDADFSLWLGPEDFLFVSTGEGRLPDLLDALAPKSPDLISLTTQYVGGSGETHYRDAMLARRFRRGTGTEQGEPILATALRTLFRHEVVKEMRPARPKLKPKYRNGKETCLWLDGNGEDVTERYLDNGWMAPREDPGFGLARLISFAAQDTETWLLRKIGTSESIPFITPDTMRATLEQYYRLNFGMVQVTALDGWMDQVEALRRQLTDLVPAIGKAQEDVVDEFSARLPRLLEAQSSEAQEAIKIFLSAKRPPPTLFQWDVPAGVETTKPPLSEGDSPWATKLVAREAEPDEDTMFAVEDEDKPAKSAPPSKTTEGEISPAPGWLSDLRLSGKSHGFYHSMPNYACSYVARSHEHLLLSFDNLSSIGENPVSRQPWGYEFVRKSGWSHMGVMSFVPGWYRDEALFSYLLSLKETGFFKQFKNVTLFGTSMGAYASCAFASLAPGCQVAAFSPQSSLASKLVPWEPRYPSGRRANWDGAFRDAAVEVAAAKDAWLFYDPRFELDVKHIERFTTPNIRHVPLRNADHKTALVLRNGRVLSKVVRSIVEGTATEQSLLSLYRKCRTTDLYLENLREHIRTSGNEARVRRLEKAISAVGPA